MFRTPKRPPTAVYLPRAPQMITSFSRCTRPASHLPASSKPSTLQFLRSFRRIRRHHPAIRFNFAPWEATTYTISSARAPPPLTLRDCSHSSCRLLWRAGSYINRSSFSSPCPSAALALSPAPSCSDGMERAHHLMRERLAHMYILSLQVNILTLYSLRGHYHRPNTVRLICSHREFPLASDHTSTSCISTLDLQVCLHDAARLVKR